jgi:antitoxin (DNA-binding transcriptional repressor) of toxin-antitoxin stability system
VETTISMTYLARHLPEVLNRVKERREHFVIQRNGEAVAIIQPVPAKPGITARELIAQVGNLKFPADDFGDDLEAVQSAQPPAEMPKWPN